MQKWEYNCHTFFFRMDRDRTNECIRTMLDGLDDYGAEGQELVYLIPHGHNVLDAVINRIVISDFQKLGVIFGVLNAYTRIDNPNQKLVCGRVE